MTAFGRAAVDGFDVEIQSVNRKQLDIVVNLPRDCTFMEIPIRKWVTEKVMRGQVTVRIVRKETDKPLPQMLKRLKALQVEWRQIASELGYDAKEVITLHFLCDHLQDAAPATSQGDVKEGIFTALAALIVMKEQEGAHLQEDLERRLKEVDVALEKVSALASLALGRFEMRLKEKLKALSLEPLTPERLAQEIVLFSHSCDISEEIVRLKSHLKQFQSKLLGKEISIGRALDFLTQEMHREMTTIAAKAQDREISLLTVEMRTLCEKLREQVQNIE